MTRHRRRTTLQTFMADLDKQNREALEQVWAASLRLPQMMAEVDQDGPGQAEPPEATTSEGSSVTTELGGLRGDIECS